MAPAGSVNREEGSDENVAISERNNVDSDLPRELNTQKAAVPWAAIALPEIRSATQSLVKAVFRKAVQVDVLVHRVISRRHTAVGQLADFQGAMH